MPGKQGRGGIGGTKKGGVKRAKTKRVKTESSNISDPVKNTKESFLLVSHYPEPDDIRLQSQDRLQMEQIFPNPFEISRSPKSIMSHQRNCGMPRDPGCSAANAPQLLIIMLVITSLARPMSYPPIDPYTITRYSIKYLYRYC